MNIHGKTALVTGANRGIGREIVRALVAAGAAKVYAGGRDLASLADTVAIDPSRITPLAIDVTNASDVASLAARAPDVTVLINNAGVLDFGTALDAPLDAFERNFAVNLYGTLNVTRALVPVIAGHGGGAIVNLSSVVALASMPGLAAYNASKAALHSLTQSLRATLKPQGIAVTGVYPGPVDTDMAASIPFDKTSPRVVAEAIVAGVIAGAEDVWPDPMAAQVGEIWLRDPKAVEHQFAAM